MGKSSGYTTLPYSGQSPGFSTLPYSANKLNAWELLAKGTPLNFLKGYKPLDFKPEDFLGPKEREISSALGQWDAPAPPNLDQYGSVQNQNWADSIAYQQAYGDMANQQAGEALRKYYMPAIMSAKLADFELQKRGLQVREQSPSQTALRGLTAAQNLAATAGAESALGNTLAYQLQAGRPRYQGSTFSVG